MDCARGVSNHIVGFIERKRTSVVMSLVSHLSSFGILTREENRCPLTNMFEQ